jgi:hypothetical protein
MPNAPEPDRGATPNLGDAAGEQTAHPGDEPTAEQPLVPPDSETETVVISTPDPEDDPDPEPDGQQRERRFTAPGFDAKETAIIATSPEPATEVFAMRPGPAGPPGRAGMPPPPSAPKSGPKSAVPQSIPPRAGEKLEAVKRFNWGLVLALVVIILALAVIAIMGTLWLTKSKHAKVSQEDQVRQTIQNFDNAVQKGDLTTLRSITCGSTRDGYVDYNEHAWEETYRRVSAAKQYPVIASIDQVVVNGQHAEANITTFMAYDPQVRSTRSLDLQFRDDQWKVCQAPSG